MTVILMEKEESNPDGEKSNHSFSNEADLLNKFDIEKYAASMGIQLRSMNFFNGGRAVLTSLFDDEMIREKKQFALSNITPPSFEKYMGFGAVSCGLNEDPYLTLRLMSDKEYLTALLETRFGIEDRDDGLRALEGLMAGYHAKKYDSIVVEARAGEKDSIGEDYCARYHTTLCAMKEILNIPLERACKCETVCGCDIEMVGYLSRILYNLDMLSEEETLGFLKDAAALARKKFTCWEGYFISVLMGWGLSNGVFVEPFVILDDLMDENGIFFEKNPICGY